jgi:hypothetical protein
MNTVPVLAAIVSVAGAVATVLLGTMFEHRRHRSRLRHVASRYSVPLLQAAHTLLNRLGNVGKISQIEEFAKLPPRFRDYARYETVYRIARYLCVVHMVWREVDFLDFGRRRHNRRLGECLGAVGHAMSDRTLGPFLLLGGEQRALGELLVDPDSDEHGPPRCLSYPAFRAKLQDDARFAEWFKPLLDDIDAVLADPTMKLPRLEPATAALRVLVDFLDKRKIGRPWIEQLS